MSIPFPAHASGPRYVAGPPFFTAPAGQPVVWHQPTVHYFTDPATLSSYVSHPQAEALVASAASVWNVPVASITLTQGGSLAEHVSSANSYLSTSGLVFPADVLSANAQAIPIAILYDTDGSLTDLLLGSGASQPSSCRQNAVTESVDSFDPTGYILHAIIILNGRCTGPLPQQQLQMQYQLERAFGRVLGLAWSQVNDNVFTGSPTPTYSQALHWPILHPIDIVCGAYTYQCLPQPFTLRPDDIASLVQLYPIAASDPPVPGKQPSLTAASSYFGHVSFPTGEGMAGVNVLVRREIWNLTIPDDYYVASAISGFGFRRVGSSAFIPAGSGPLQSLGNPSPDWQGYYLLPYIPLEDTSTNNFQTLIFSTEPINPLYTGAYSLGPYPVGNVTPSGSPVAPLNLFFNGSFAQNGWDFPISTAASTCSNGADGTPGAPVPITATGWGNGLICAWNHVSWLTASIRARRSFTVEVTALDEQGLPTESKAMPVVALYAPGDALTSPSLGIAPAAFQSRTYATTTLTASTAQATQVTLAIADQRGDGRPDFPYQVRLFYTDTVTPATVPLTTPATLTITGLGFRPGNAVSINGQPATVLSSTANSITLTAPTLGAAHALPGVPVDITVSDLSTGATSTLSAALTYTAAPTLPNVLRLLSAPSGTVFVGDPAPTPFALQLLASDGQTPIPNSPIVLTAASATFDSCASPCTLLTDATGTISTSVTPTAPGSITVQATSAGLAQSAIFTAQAQPGVMQLLDAPVGPLLVGVEAPNPFLVRIFDSDGHSIASQLITFTTLTGSSSLRPCFTSTCTVTADPQGYAAVFLTATTAGPITLQASVGNVHRQVTVTALPNLDSLQIVGAPPSQILADSAQQSFIVELLRGDGSPDPLQPVTLSASSNLVINQCGVSACTLATNWGGTVGVTFSAHQPGTVTLTAAFGSLTRTYTFTVLPHTYALKVLSAPSGSFPVGQVIPTPFTVQLLEDGVTPVVNTEIILAGVVGSVDLSGCPNATCDLMTDGNGIVSTNVTPIVAGVLYLSATSSSANQTISFTALGVPQSIRVWVQPPSTGTLVGDIANFGTQLVGADGITPIGNVPVTFSVLSGPFVFLTCHYVSCTGTSDPNGMNLIWGEATAPGNVTLQASWNGISTTVTFTVSVPPTAARSFALSASPARTWFAAGATLTLPLNAALTLNGSPAGNQTLTWTSTPGFVPDASSSLTASDGSVALPATLGPLAAGASALATVCGPSNSGQSLCQPLTAYAVDPSAFQLSILTGALQSIASPQIFTPVIVQVTDAAGHPIAAAPMTVSQTVTALDAVCPTQGRCPAAAVLASRITSTISAPDGTLAITPLTVSGQSTQTNLAISTGTQGFLTTVLTTRKP